MRTSTLNGQTGDVTIAQGTGIQITTAAGTITVAATGGGAGVSVTDRVLIAQGIWTGRADLRRDFWYSEDILADDFFYGNFDQDTVPYDAISPVVNGPALVAE